MSRDGDGDGNGDGLVFHVVMCMYLYHFWRGLSSHLVSSRVCNEIKGKLRRRRWNWDGWRSCMASLNANWPSRKKQEARSPLPVSHLQGAAQLGHLFIFY
ncbi:hypothetical protein Dimus_002234 [Dionaea muscipula]